MTIAQKSLVRLAFLLVVFLVTVSIANYTQAQLEEDRVAFVIGNSDYVGSAKLANPTNDSSAISDELKKLGFETYLFQNLKVEDVSALKQQLEARLKRNSRLIFYYAGHGVQLESKNYLLPINASFKNPDTLANQSLYLGDILQAIQKSRPRLSVVVLDACRDNPFGSDKSGSSSKGGLARVDPPASTVIFYATRPGGTASDGEDKNGLFTKSLLAELKKPEVTLEVIFRRVSTSVYEISKGDQEPWIEGVIREEFVVNQSGSVQLGIEKPVVMAVHNSEQLAPQKVVLADPISVPSPVATPEKIALASDALTNSHVAGRSLTYVQALENIEKDIKSGNTESSSIYSCVKDVCTSYKDYARSLVDDENLNDLKDRLRRVVEGQMKVCIFDLESNKCVQNSLPVTIYNPLMLFFPKSEIQGVKLLEPSVSNSGGLSFKADLMAGRGSRSIPCSISDGKIDFLNERIDMTLARVGCFGVMPSTAKITFDVLLWDFDKSEILVNWNFNMLSVMAFGRGGGTAKLMLPKKG
ncbi:hypothetical protein B9Z35_04160 [Limnohabitans sp. Jir61]|uniref:caspase family protein n=1 Tax=Limnohabitans sp. Jir61 TaxID=1826168 RepID=UPI000D337392|nr:caspase family protein [Limnohabitans sp. Jir61]PUE32734.1 hypothetical protein B9Z35_04160 [Limnohabitans sp. Jir61]